MNTNNIKTQSLFLCLILFFLLTQTKSAFAQQRFEGNLVAGVVLAQIDGDRLIGYNKFGFQAGAKVNTILNDRWSIGLEFLYTQHGSSRTLNDSPSATFEKIQLNLVEAPVMLYFRDWKFELGAGISYASLINFEAIDIFGEDVSDTQDYANNIFSMNLSVGFHFTDNWTLDVRWSKYLSNLQADPGAGTFLGKNIAIRGIYTL